jgi:ABC-type transport system involved in multi-copper enzyme maturation permease subunit
LEDFWKNDLPEGFDPMTAKELRQSLRRGSFVLPFLGIQLLALVAMIAEFRGSAAAGASEMLGTLNPWLLWNAGPFWRVVGVICVIVMPLGGVALMGQELEEGNHELLLLTKLNRWRIVLGKFVTLWGMSAITFISLLPYVVIRYFVGGVEWWNEASCAATVLGLSAMIGAGAIGASSFLGIGARIAMMLLFLASMVVGSLIPLVASALIGRGAGVFYQLTALAAAVCYSTVGLALARSRLRLTVMDYEAKPVGRLIALLVFAPFGIGMVTAFTCGYGGFVALLLVALLAKKSDVTPHIHPIRQLDPRCPPSSLREAPDKPELKF